MFAPGLPSVLSSLAGSVLETRAGSEERSALGQLRRGDRQSPMALARILATVHDKNGRIAFPDSTRMRGGIRRSEADALTPFDDKTLMKETGVNALGGEKGYTTLEKLWIRPTCEVNGLLSGYTGEGAKTVLPAKAMAKVSCRLVPDQDPADIEKLMKAHVAKVCPEGRESTSAAFARRSVLARRAEWRFTMRRGARCALRFGKEPFITGEGGSSPSSATSSAYSARRCAVGFGLPLRERPRAGRVDERRKFPGGTLARRRCGRVRSKAIDNARHHPGRILLLSHFTLGVRRDRKSHRRARLRTPARLHSSCRAAASREWRTLG